MLTAKSDTVDVVAGLESGADDYIVQAVQAEGARRPHPRPAAPQRRAGAERLRIGDLEIDVAGHQVMRDGAAIALTPLEFDLLVALARSRGRCSPARCCSSRCGATGTRPTPGW